MKKLLSIVICVILGVGSMWATVTTHTVKAYAIASDRTSTTQYSGGTVKIQGYNLKENSFWGQFTGCTETDGSWVGPATSVETTTQSSNQTVPIVGTKYPAKISMVAEQAEGYYFKGWATTNDINATTLTWEATTGKVEIGSNKTYYAIFYKKLRYNDYNSVTAIIANPDGTLQKDENGNYVVGGGYVNINSEATTSHTTFAETGTDVIQYVEQASYTFVRNYFRLPADNFMFIGWYTKSELEALNGQLNLENVAFSGVNRSVTYTSTLDNEILTSEPMYAVFRPSVTYYHYGPHAAIAGHSEDWLDEGGNPKKGLIYASATNVAPANGQWTAEEIEDKTNITESKDVAEYTFYYFAKPVEGYAFKGWAESQYGEPLPSSTIIADGESYSYEHTAKEANITRGNPHTPQKLFAVFEALFYKAPPADFANLSDGLGKIAVSFVETSTPTYSDKPITAGERRQVPNLDEYNDSYSYTVHYYATPNPGSQFVGWSSTADGTSIVSQDTHYPKNYTTFSKDEDAPQVAPPLYAVFKSDIDIRQQDRMIVYIDDEGNGNINDAKVLVDFQKAELLTATISGGNTNLFTLSNRSGSKKGSTINFDATQGLIEMVVSYIGDLSTAVGKSVQITFSANYDNTTVSRTITITVEEAPIITFLPTDGKGAYTIKMTNGSGVNYTVNADTKENTKVAITHESMSNIEMNITTDISTDDYYFFGWQMINGEEVAYISYDELCNYQFTKSVKVRPEFIPNNHATYFIKDDATNTHYHDFQRAIDDAEELSKSTGNQQIVVLDPYPHGTNNAKIVERILPKGSYSIPAGVAVFIPCVAKDDNGDGVVDDYYYTYKETLDGNDCVSGDAADYKAKGFLYKKAGATTYSAVTASTFDEYVQWKWEDGTEVEVDGGRVCVAAVIASSGADLTNGRPTAYGHIKMGENCNFNFINGSELYAHGYITGPLTSSVVMNDGTVVKETFQIYDFKGGTATGFGYNTMKNNKVFIVGQFYVQNVEVPLTVMPGATEKIFAGIFTNDAHTIMQDIVFIAEDEGFVHLGDGMAITKYYEPYQDRLVFEAKKVKDNPSKIGKLGDVTIDVGVDLIGEISSSSFVLPIPSNYDIVMKDNIEMQVLYDAAFSPGSTLTINKGCTLKMNGNNVYIYDDMSRNVNGKGYYGATNSEAHIISNRPGGVLYRRIEGTSGNYGKLRNPVDAKIVVDGLLDASNGYLYTTHGSSPTDYANITSNGGGQIKLGATLGTKQDVSQVQYNGELLSGYLSRVKIPVVSARMRNANSTYTESAVNTIFTYLSGTWTPNTTMTEEPNISHIDYIPRFTITGTTTMTAYVGETQENNTLLPTLQNDNVDWNEVDWTFELKGQDANQFSLSGEDDKVFDDKDKVFFTPTSEGTKKVTLVVTATYSRTVNSQTIKYTYSKAIFLVGNALSLQPNTLTFADLSTLYVGQTIPLLANGNNRKNVTVTTSNASIATVNTNVLWNAATIQAKAASKDEITITVSQDPDFDRNIAGTTITKKVKVTERVVWNWDILYFGTINENPVTVLDGSTDWTLTETTDEKNIIDYNAANKTATTADMIAGKYEVTFTFTQNGQSQPFYSTVITDPRHLRVDVNNDTVFRAVTLSANENVNFRGKQITFTSTAQSISQWKLGFYGVPDKLCFIPNGSNTWQIEESSNGVNWTTSFPWKKLPTNESFEWSLIPSTRYVRISYGAGNVNPTTKVNNATLNEFYITELTDVKADLNKLYMPVESDGAGGFKSVIKEVVLTYANVSKIGVNVRALDSRDRGFFSIKKPDGTLTDSYNWTSLPEFGVMGLEVVCHPTAEKEVEGVIDVFADSKQVLQIPIQTYLFPQELPIKFATDKPDGGDRYYFVTTHTHNAEWDGTDGVRTITLQNAVSDAAPYLTFAFKGAPTYISFNYTDTAKGTWEIEESIDGKSWTMAAPKEGDVMADGYLKRTVTATSQYLKVIYESPYAEKVEITNLVIVGDASVVVPARLELDYNVPEALIVSAINLPSMTLTTDNLNFQVTHGTDNGTYTDPSNPSLTLTSSDYPAALGENKMGDVPIFVKWTGDNAIEYATLTITNPADSKVLGVVELVGMKSSITDGEINISTGVAPGYTLNGSFDENGKKHRPVDVKAAFSEAGTAHFDYVVVYGETTTDDGSKTITTPNTMVGSNAKTPCYIYKRKENAYELKKVVENTNSKDKAWYLTDMLDVNGEEQVTDPLDMDAVQIPNGKESVSMYITGFCPYASTGYTKADEGVWYFRAKGGQSIDIYMEDCYIYSRSKTADGHAFIDRQDGYSFSERFVCGTGAVFVFACNETANATSMNVTIHTLDSNLVKSHYGCFLQSIAGRAYQASSPVQIRVLDDTYVTASKTTLNFTDEWPVSKNPITATRTNGFVSLQKQVNNAPSIDMGNKNTIVNFNGGQVELQNAQIVSTNYKSSLAICPRSGEFAGVLLAYGMGTDDVRGTVYFNDGTTTVLPMYVSPNFAESYLLDKDANGSYITNSKGEFRTSCLRTPTNTFVTGGSHCMMRACKDPSSQGGAPKDKLNGTPLGLYKYPSASWTETVDGNTVTHKGGWSPNGSNGLVTPTAGNVPTNYKVESVIPNNNGTEDNANDDYLNFWFDPNFESAAQPEVDRTKSFWKTCMTRIEADYGGYGGAVGGPTEIAMAGDVQDEIVKYLLYCKIDENILSVLKDETYQAPVKNPAPSGDNYVPVHPSKVEGTEYFISNKDTFRVNEKIYYITTATADVWNAFTAPFDVENIYIMETYPENELEEMEWKGKKNRSDILMEQAKHNADFAAFFAVTIALGQEKTFETIYREYMIWADLQDETLGLNAKNDYTQRGMKPLTPYDGSNWQEADFYLNENAGNWVLHEHPDSLAYFKTQWITPDLSDGTLMEQGKTYSMLLPFCTGCVDYEIQTDANGNPVKDAEGKPVFKLDANGNKIPLARDYWDYWSGKFLIFESTYAGPVELPTGEVVDGPGHTIYGSDYVEGLAASTEYIESSAVLTGNCSFADLQTMNSELFTYSPDIKHSTFSPIELPVDGLGNTQPLSIVPTESFLVADIPTPAGVKVRGVSRTGEIIYDKQGTATGNQGGRIPTVGGGNDLFITSTATGINIAVAEPQQVRVMSATGATLFSGMVQTAVDVFLPTAGVYVVAGDNEVHKILH